MLKSHRNLLEPRPSDRLRIGDRVVDLSLREIVPADGSAPPIRVTLKSIGVLLVLVANAGKLVSREALLEWVWPDTMPTDDVVTQAVAQLRKSLGDDRESPRYIDTVAKQGYRLIAPVEWLTDHETDSANDQAVADAGVAHDHLARAPLPGAGIAPAGSIDNSALSNDIAVAMSAPVEIPQATRRRALSRLMSVVAVTLIVSTAAAYWWQRDRASSPSSSTLAAQPTNTTEKPTVLAMPSFRLITSKPQGEYRPTLSPDGALLAYVEESAGSVTSSLWVQTTAPVPPQRLTESVDGQWDMMPTWSPDGRQIAFIRENKKRCSVMLIPASGGSAREVGECLSGSHHRLGWYPDGRALIAGLTPSHFGSLSKRYAIEKALYRMSIENGRWERIAYERSPNDEDMMPAVSPDGRWIVFQRNLALGDLWRIPVGGGKPQRLTYLRGNFHGVAWMPDSRGLVFGRYADGRSMLARLDIDTARIYDYRSSDRRSLLYPTIAGNGSAIAFESETTRLTMHGMSVADVDERPPVDSKQSPLMRSDILFETTGSNWTPSIAPDGRQLMFSSDRSAEVRLWWVDQTQPDSLRHIEGFKPFIRYPAVWDAASKHALVIGEGAEGMGAYEVDPQRGHIVKLPLPDSNPVHVAYHTDPKRFLAVVERGEGRLGAVLYDRSARPWRRLAEIDDVAAAMVDAANSRIVLARMSSAELWQTDLALAHPRKIDETAIQRRNRVLVASQEGMWVMDSGPGCAWRWRLVAREGKAPPQEQCLSVIDIGLSGISYHPGQRRVYFSNLEQTGTDIALLPLSALQPPESSRAK